MPSQSKFQSSSSQGIFEYRLTDGDSVWAYGAGHGPSLATWTDSVTFGANVPGWRDALRNGTDATTTMEGSRSVIRVKPGHFTHRITDGAWFYITVGGLMRLNHGLPEELPDELSDASAKSFALGKFEQKLNLVNTAIQGGVVLGELRQTLQTIRNPAMGLRRLVDDGLDVLRSIRAARRVGSLAAHKKAVLENLADAWLELQFGWKPLLNDIDSAGEALRRYNTGQSIHTRRISATERTEQVTSDVYGYVGESFAYWNTHRVHRSRVEAIFRGAVRVEAVDPQELSPELIGFNPRSFLPTAWELIPYSFLVDYFTNIGGIVYGLSNLGTRLAWCNYTVRRTTEKQQDTMDREVPGVTASGAHASVFSARTTVSRAKYTGTGVPALAFKLPGFGSLKWLNIAALVASRRSDRSWTFD